MKIDKISDPYCYQRLAGIGPLAFLPLNRNYKPLGVSSRHFVDYEAYAREHGYVTFKVEPSLLKTWVNTAPGATMFWLYADSEDSRRTYWNRLAEVRGEIQ